MCFPLTLWLFNLPFQWQVLVGENPAHEMGNIMPSKAGLQTVLQVLKIQLKYWPVLASNYTTLQSQWDLVSSKMSE